MRQGDEPLQTTAAALQQWRSAEQALAVSRRGRVAAQAAVDAAQQAADAANATAKAAKAALASANLAEATATKTALAARVMIDATRADLADADAEVAVDEVSEAGAHLEYKAAVNRAAARRNTGRP